jgi:hypothetical protein
MHARFVRHRLPTHLGRICTLLLMTRWTAACSFRYWKGLLLKVVKPGRRASIAQCCCRMHQAVEIFWGSLKGSPTYQGKASRLSSAQSNRDVSHVLVCHPQAHANRALVLHRQLSDMLAGSNRSRTKAVSRPRRGLAAFALSAAQIKSSTGSQAMKRQYRSFNFNLVTIKIFAILRGKRRRQMQRGSRCAGRALALGWPLSRKAAAANAGTDMGQRV